MFIVHSFNKYGQEATVCRAGRESLESSLGYEGHLQEHQLLKWPSHFRPMNFGWHPGTGNSGYLGTLSQLGLQFCPRQ